MSNPHADYHNRAGSATGRIFGEDAFAYHYGRSTYPPEMIEWCLSPEFRIVLDLAAGTGQIAHTLDHLGVASIMVDVDERMLVYGPRGLPKVAAIAEQLPFREDVFDAIFVGQAFHWFDTESALAEIARVLKPDGILIVIQVLFDDRVPWIADICNLYNPLERLSFNGGLALPPFVDRDKFSLPEVTQFTHKAPCSLWQILARVQSSSKVIAMDHLSRQSLLEDVTRVVPFSIKEVSLIYRVWISKYREA
jgi:SAM-dependent methyltransferase